MQPAPARLQQVIWTAFKAARPVKRSLTEHFSQQQPRACFQPQLLAAKPRRREPCLWTSLSCVRFYSEDKRSEIERKVDDAQQRINNTIDSRADNVINLPGPEEDTLKKPKDETIVHTLPESSSIVYSDRTPGEAASRSSNVPAPDTAEASTAGHAPETSEPKPEKHDKTRTEDGLPTGSSRTFSSELQRRDLLPSQLAARYSLLRSQMNSFMDNFQTHVFTASKRLNDLTGYTSIEQLKKDIEAQEHNVRTARQNVHDTRSSYQQAIETRSDTQKEVNDLLHRKHNWSSSDLERFTSLYRSDHANEQAEQKSHEHLSRAEQQYEEASNRLSKSILARYHEEQVWSDKIRQMSTWGTWGLMGLNVLLFVVFQILIEPWRRRRLVKGFEEKVQEALREQNVENELRTIFHIKAAQEVATPAAAVIATTTTAAAHDNAQPSTNSDVTTTSTPATGTSSVAAAETALADAIAEAALATATDAGPTIAEMSERAHIEQAAETATTAELLFETPEKLGHDAATAATLPSVAEIMDGTGVLHSKASPESASTDDVAPDPVAESIPPLATAPYADLPFLLGTHVRIYFDRAKTQLRALFDETSTITVSRRDLTNRALESALFGAVGVVTLFWVMGVGAWKRR